MEKAEGKREKDERWGMRRGFSVLRSPFSVAQLGSGEDGG
jgi:hypothetical protein